MIRGFVQAAVPNIPNTAKEGGRKEEGRIQEEERKEEGGMDGRLGDVGEV